MIEQPDHLRDLAIRYRKIASSMADPDTIQALKAMARASKNESFTLIHQSDDAEHNSATALYEFLSELEAYSKPE